MHILPYKTYIIVFESTVYFDVEMLLPLTSTKWKSPEWKLGLIFCNCKVEQYYCSTKRFGGYLEEKQERSQKTLFGWNHLNEKEIENVKLSQFRCYYSKFAGMCRLAIALIFNWKRHWIFREGAWHALSVQAHSQFTKSSEGDDHYLSEDNVRKQILGDKKHLCLLTICSLFLTTGDGLKWFQT